MAIIKCKMCGGDLVLVGSGVIDQSFIVSFFLNCGTVHGNGLRRKGDRLELSAKFAGYHLAAFRYDQKTATFFAFHGSHSESSYS